MNISPAVINSLQISPISNEQRNKILKDLKFISLLTEAAKIKNMRVIIHGGYAVDGFFGKLTRPHNDIDVGIYGNLPDGNKMIQDLLDEIYYKDSTYKGIDIEDKGRGNWIHEFKLKHNSFLAEVYYVQIKGNAFDSTKVVISRDGITAEPEDYDTYKCILEGFHFEGCTPVQAIVDRLYKQKRGDGIKPHHTQDIENLKLITDANEVNNRLTSYRGY